MELVVVESSNIVAVGYDHGNLIIKFKSGTYLYEGVDRVVYESLLIAESKGKFVCSNIKNKYKCTKLTEAK